MSRILENLTPAQLEAVTHRDGPMLVIAGAGSGKTRVVTRRIAWLLEQGVPPGQILAMTFTNKAAREMRQRIQELTGCEFPFIGTFHSLCARFLRRDIEALDCGRTHAFTIYDDDERSKLATACMKEIVSRPPLAPKVFLSILGKCKNSQQKIVDYLDTDDSFFSWSQRNFLVEIAKKYEERMQQCNAVDFDDLLLLMVRLLKEVPGMQEMYQNRFRYLLVDEYQDTNHLQYELIHLLAGLRANVHVTGDPDQSIYSWRGADYHNIMDFENDYVGAKVIKLEQNYRSTKTILAASNQLISRNKWRYDKQLFTDNAEGKPIIVREEMNPNDEADWVVRQIRELHLSGVNYRQIAVFYRTNAQSRPLEESVIKANLPYQLLGGIRYYERQEVKDFLAFLRLKTNESDEMALRRVLDCNKCGIGAKKLSELLHEARLAEQPLLSYICSPSFAINFSARNGKAALFAEWCQKLRAVPESPVGEAAEKILELSQLLENAEKQYGPDNLEERKENINGLVERARSYERDNPSGTLTGFLEEVALVADVDNHDATADCIVLMTLHSSKGLEFPYVFIVGVENGLLPHANSMEKVHGSEEERRLLYVGLTRAKCQVFLSYALERYQFRSGWTRSMPSLFLDELPENLLRWKRKFSHSKEELFAEDDDQEPDDSLKLVKKDGFFLDFSEGDSVFLDD